MKMIIAVIQPDKLGDVKDALHSANITKMTASNVIGCGQQMGYAEKYRGIPMEINLYPHGRVGAGRHWLTSAGA